MPRRREADASLREGIHQAFVAEERGGYELIELLGEMASGMRAPANSGAGAVPIRTERYGQ